MEKLTTKSTVGEALKNPKAVAAIEALIPGITKNPVINMFKKITLDKLPAIEQLHLSKEKLDEMLEEVNKED